ncbi:multiubiquitin domain-containing protein [Phenylobacterium sp.]|jgi:hypothetical protein|uniref:multiubiquitin domain-containing protein n=1 Tax=Phenylobacterium sp. TaxID=1871053 RepID=UPI002E331259|nr:multiubiquitin domain-containing protein [Phenylobacterium sp.]HEX3365781.1 multiubiquitin domain-containing protein [Phenylobacterium sp.]
MNQNEEGDEGEKLEAFEEKQAHALEDFEAKQQRELQAFEQKEREELEAFERRQGRPFTIKIDRTEYEVRERKRTGAQLRTLAGIGADRDLFEVVPGGSDVKIADDMEVKMRDGLRFFTAPAQINPGTEG